MQNWNGRKLKECIWHLKKKKNTKLYPKYSIYHDIWRINLESLSKLYFFLYKNLQSNNDNKLRNYLYVKRLLNHKLQK